MLEAQFFGAVLTLCNDAVLNTQVSRDLSDVSMPVLDRDTRRKHDMTGGNLARALSHNANL
jgi:hypothetical protein